MMSTREDKLKGDYDGYGAYVGDYLWLLYILSWVRDME